MAEYKVSIYNTTILAIALVLGLKYCEDTFFDKEEVTVDMLINYQLERTQGRAGSLEDSLILSNNPPPMTEEQRMNRINELLQEMGHKPVGPMPEDFGENSTPSRSLSNPGGNAREAQSEQKEKDNQLPRNERPTDQASGRRTTKKLDALGYVINEPNSSRDLYCLNPGGCRQDPATEELIILEVPEGTPQIELEEEVDW